MSARIRLGVVDHCPLLRIGIVQTLAKAHDCEVVAEGSGHGDALRIAAEHAPDVLVFDLYPEISVQIVQRLATEFPAMRTIVLTMAADEDQVVASLRAGAAGYILKDATGAELIESIRRVHRGQVYVDPSIAAQLLRVPLRHEQKADLPSTLTSREKQVWECLTHGLSNKEIARELKITEVTAKHHVAKVLEKLEVRNRVEAAVLGQRWRSPAKR